MAGASTCVHGYSPGVCLICQMLEKREASPKPGPRVIPREAPRGAAPAVIKLAGVASMAVLAVVVAWTVLHLAFAIIHLLELVAVAVVAGYVGWAIGLHEGRRRAGRQ